MTVAEVDKDDGSVIAKNAQNNTDKTNETQRMDEDKTNTTQVVSMKLACKLHYFQILAKKFHPILM